MLEKKEIGLAGAKEEEVIDPLTVGKKKIGILALDGLQVVNTLFLVFCF